MEIIGALDLDPDTVQAGLFTGELKINGKPLDGQFLKDHEVCVTVRAEPTAEGTAFPFYLSLHQLIIDGKSRGTFA